MSNRITQPDGAAPLYVRCQQQDIHRIRDDVKGHGPQKVASVTLGSRGLSVQLACGCTILSSWLPRWEQAAVREWSQVRQDTREIEAVAPNRRVG